MTPPSPSPTKGREKTGHPLSSKKVSGQLITRVLKYTKLLRNLKFKSKGEILRSAQNDKMVFFVGLSLWPALGILKGKV
jgi:hypothetical protein